MKTFLPSPTTGPATSPRAREAARRRFVLLCLTLLVLLSAGLVHFIATDLQTLQGVRTAAATTLVAVPADAPQDVESAARREHATAVADVARGWWRVGGLAGCLVFVATFLLVHRKRDRPRGDIVNAATLMLLLVGTVLLLTRFFLRTALPHMTLLGLVDVLVLHIVAALIMPWTTREATLPAAVLLLIWAITYLAPGGPTTADLVDRVVIVILSPLLLIPGGAIAGWRWRRRQEDAERRALAGRVELFGGELSRARIVHDAMFPSSFTGHVAFEYEYQPIQEIGGDYVHTYVDPETESVMVTLLDVAGHGLAAALTVNRLFGEIERILAENPRAQPCEIIELLNRYIFLTMSGHSLFATGTCMRVDPSMGIVQWVNAGHPPAIIRPGHGDIDELSTTTMVLGVLEPDAFEAGQCERPIQPGDTIIAYTDGAFEARDRKGDRFGMDRLRELARFDPPPRSWPKFIAGAVGHHHGGKAEDDVLIAAITLRSRRVAVAKADATPAMARVDS